MSRTPRTFTLTALDGRRLEGVEFTSGRVAIDGAPCTYRTVSDAEDAYGGHATYRRPALRATAPLRAPAARELAGQALYTVSA